jgi:hypothetical protein
MEKKILNIFILNILISITKSLVVFPFKTLINEEPSEFINPLDMLTYWDNNIIYSNSFIGTPSQEITIFFHSQNFSSNLYYHMCDFAYSSYERKQSSSFSFIRSLNKVYPMENASLVSDKFYFFEDLNAEKKKEYTLPFIYSDNDKETQKDKYEEHDYTCMSIGLQRESTVYHEPECNFMTQLFKVGIETYDFTLEYLTQNEGRIIIGEEPYIYDKSKSNKKYKVSGAINEKDRKSFFLNCDSIYMMKDKEQKEELGSRSVKIIIDKGLILGPEDYRKKIKSLFFDDMEGKCFEYRNQSKFFYWCYKSAENEVKNKFPTLYFHMQPFFKVFELTYEDLFQEKNGKLYFLVYFKNMNPYEYFEIGKILLKKYTFTFNQYNNHIGYYNKDIKIEGEDDEEKTSFWENKYLWIIISVLVVIFAGLGIFIGKKVRDNDRKKRLNEVDDDNYEYEQPENDDNKLFKSEDEKD